MTKQSEFDFNSKKAAALRDQGIERTKKKVYKEDPEWLAMAYNLFVNVFLRDWNGPFRAEQFRQFCAQMDKLPDSEVSMRVFGGIMLKAKHAGIIKKVGTQNTEMPNSHGTPAGLWIQVKPSERK